MGADADALAGKVNRCWHTSTRRSNFAQTKHPDILSSSPSELFCCFRAGSHSREQDWFMTPCLLGQGNFTMDLFELPYCLSISDPRKERQNSFRLSRTMKISRRLKAKSKKSLCDNLHILYVAFKGKTCHRGSCFGATILKPGLRYVYVSLEGLLVRYVLYSSLWWMAQ